MKKIINSADRDYQPVETQNLVLDAVPTVNSFNSVTSDAVARAVAGASGEVPQVTESDNGKVLKAIYDAGGPAVEWGEAAVDQSYDATSTNAQSGTAVAQAIAAIPSSSYTAGDGIDITSNEVSVKAGSSLSFETVVTTKTLQSPVSTNSTYALLGQLDSEIVAALKAGTVTVKPLLAFSVPAYTAGVHFVITQKTDYNTPNAYFSFIASDTVSSMTSGTFTMVVGDSYTADFSSIEQGVSPTTWSAIEADPTSYYLALISYDTDWSNVEFANVPAAPGAETADVLTVELVDADAPKKLSVTNPLPAYAAGDAGKVLQVNAGGNGTQWTNYVPAEVVQALPANPTSGVLYIVTGA